MSAPEPQDAVERARQRQRQEVEAAAAAKLGNAEATGAAIPFDPEEAEAAGAFKESALSEDDASEARE